MSIKLDGGEIDKDLPFGSNDKIVGLALKGCRKNLLFSSPNILAILFLKDYQTFLPLSKQKIVLFALKIIPFLYLRF
jgi:hypothetical protein